MLWSYQSAEALEPQTETSAVKPTSQKVFEIFNEFAEAMRKWCNDSRGGLASLLQRPISSESGG